MYTRQVRQGLHDMGALDIAGLRQAAMSNKLSKGTRELVKAQCRSVKP